MEGMKGKLSLRTEDQTLKKSGTSFLTVQYEAHGYTKTSRRNRRILLAVAATRTRSAWLGDFKRSVKYPKHSAVEQSPELR